MITTQYKVEHGWANCIDGFRKVATHTYQLHIIRIGAMVGPAHLVEENPASGSIDSVCLVNNHVVLDTYWTVY